MSLIGLCFGLALLSFSVRASEVGAARSFTISTYPRIDGSTSTQPLAAIVACRLLGCSYGWVTHENGSKYIVPYASNSSLGDSIKSLVTHSGTHEAYLRLINREVELILVARLPSSDERALAAEKGVNLECRPAARDAFVFLTHTLNPVRSLTREQIRAIYSEKIDNWRQVGGPNKMITPYGREENSGSRELMIDLVMGSTPMIETQDLIRTGMIGPYLALEHDTAGLAYTVYFYQTMMAPKQNVRMCAVDKVLPSYRTIRSKHYPFSTDVFLVVLTELPPESPAGRLRQWLIGKEGQRVVKESGYVPIRK